MKRKSTISSSTATIRYEEAIGKNLSQHGMQSKSSYDISTRVETKISETEEHNGTNENEQWKERPKSLPPDSNEAAAATIPDPKNQPQNETTELRPIPKPRPKTMFLKHDSTRQVLRAKTMSAENLLKTIPAVERVRSGSEIEWNTPPVPLKRAQRYRSQEGISSNAASSSKESKF